MLGVGAPAGFTGAPQVVPAGAPPVATAPNAPQPGTGILPAGISPYVLALGGLALIWALVEGVMIARRKSNRRRETHSDGH